MTGKPSSGQAAAPPNGKRGVLIVTAHPDDEAFVSGSLCLLAEARWTMALVCVTDGEGGADELLPLAPGVGLADVRRREVALSAEMLGVGALWFLGMPDVAECDAEWNQAELVARLSEIVARVTPELILTHGPKGGYGNAAHQLVHRCVMQAAERAGFAGSIFSFCGQVPDGFFSWHFDQPSDVVVDVRGFLSRRAASLGYHQSQLSFFVQPRAPRSLRKLLSALFGYAFAFTEAGRKRVPINTAERFFRRFPHEGLALQQTPLGGRPHFFQEHFARDPRVQTAR